MDQKGFIFPITFSDCAVSFNLSALDNWLSNTFLPKIILPSLFERGQVQYSCVKASHVYEGWNYVTVNYSCVKTSRSSAPKKIAKRKCF